MDSKLYWIRVAKAAGAGLLGAAAADIHVWLGYHSWSDFKTFDFGTASYRWFIGAATGAAAAMGYGSFLA
jgi:hypothetical protein